MSKPIYILGLNAYHADSSAAILRDGILIAATEEERFRRVKHWAGFPSQAIDFCIREAGISIDQVDHIAIGRDPSAKMAKKLAFAAMHPGVGLRALKNRMANRKQVLSLGKEFQQLYPSHDEAYYAAKIHNVEHHRAHLASAFYASPFDRAALLSIDGSGDFTTTMFGLGDGTHMEILDSVDFPHSIGIFYSAATQFLGFPHYGDEYKVMGLAPYGEPRYLDKLEKIVTLTPDGAFKLNMDYFNVTKGNVISYGDDHIPVVDTLYSNSWSTLFGPSREKNAPLTQEHKDFAASVQRYTEQIIFHLLHHLHKQTQIADVCIAGGVAQNSVANGKITRNTPFKRVYIPSAGHDAGISMGAALYVHHEILKQKRNPSVRSAYTGSRFSNEDIIRVLHEEGISFTQYDDAELYDKVSGAIHQGGVIGWFSGRAEFGPRALGARSILADPSRQDAKELLNSKVKRRESFRPFAPSILAPFVEEYFEVHEPVPFMEKVYPIRKEKQHIIPAVTHVDGTGRLQSVEEDIHPRYYRLIESFYKKSGIPILLNTSFNENEPIVNSPREALECFKRTHMDMLVMENIVVERHNLKPNA